jgi:23S rRNA (guanosine2251-2'-O)-methyltransferase
VSRAFVLYGRNPIREALRAGRRPVHRVWATRGAAAEPWLRDVEVLEAGPEEIAARAGSEAHQGLCAEAGPYPYADPGELLGRPDPLVVVLDELQDPQNLGAICRTAECVGADGVVIPERRSAEVTAVVCKASAGAVEHLDIAHVRNLADWLADAKQANFWIWGADAEAKQAPWNTDLSGPTVLVLGGEGKGIRPRVASACDGLVALPRAGSIDSLNVSAAAAALLFEATRQRLSQ